MSGKYEIDIWSGDWGLPSIDFSCLQILAYCRFSGVPFKANQTNNPFWSPLPLFRHKTVKLIKLNDVIQHLKHDNYSADFNLSPKDVSDVKAYAALLKRQLEPALLYLLWMNDRNYVELTRGWYAKRLPFPTNYFIPNRIKSETEKCIRSRFSEEVLNNDAIDEIIENTIIGDAQKCITLLSQRLKDEFFFGKNPSSFDAIVFGYLAPLLKVPFPNPLIQNHLKACDNLTKFVNQILNKYFPAVKDSSNINESKTSVIEVNDFPHKWRDMIFSGLFATTAMIGYAFAVGLITFDVIDDDYDADDAPVPDLLPFIGYEDESEEKE